MQSVIGLQITRLLILGLCLVEVHLIDRSLTGVCHAESMLSLVI